MDLTEAVYRSRKTIFKVLETRGYNTTPYAKLGVNEIKVFTNYRDNYPGLNMIIYKHEDESKKVMVNYTTTKMNQYQRIITQIEEMELNADNDELMFMMQEPVNDKVHSLVAAYFWDKNKLRVSFFCIYEIVVNPLEHELVPRHELVPKDDIPALMKQLKINDIRPLPVILFHTDPIARLLGLVPHDVVKITRPSPSSGEYIVYRKCA